MPVSKGQWNFDEIKLTYFLDRTPAFEEFKSGKLDYWAENVASQWATAYDFPAVEKGWVKKEAIPVKRVAPMQAFVFNLRRKQFQDPRVRKAFALTFNFEEANKKLFYDLYVRVASYFDNSELAATGLPQGRELEILNEVQRRGAARGLHNRMEEPRQRDSRSFPRAHARGVQAARRGGLEGAGADRRRRLLRLLLQDPAHRRFGLSQDRECPAQ